MLQTAGFIKLVREKDGPIVGVHMLGARVGELIGEGQMMVNWEAYPDDVARLVHAHPTQNDAIGEAALGSVWWIMKASPGVRRGGSLRGS